MLSMKTIITSSIAALALSFFALSARAETLTKEQAMVEVSKNSILLASIERVETGGEKNPAVAVGDHGKALGWMQIHPDYYAQAKKSAPWLPPYRTVCKDKTLSRVCVVAHWASYNELNKSNREKALVHHYGPSGRKGKKNFSDTWHKYWDKVSK